ncbi:T6SS phospholipase effector Tle1-like catalytic domain-containing protein [Myroides odoratus]|uniref:T6SS phospholipase effector Tle1-like catalytic domain-containing protein n=1 Tax=Myroides odoratus TaxID=256 RepID=UPI0039AF2EF0
MKTEQTNETSIALFFDGTGNNMTNSQKDPVKYGNLTNIAQLFDACTLTDKVYIEGVGTRDQMEDSVYAKATGNNPLGYSGYSYLDKLDKGISFLKTYSEQHPNETLNILIYGFSRGATLARNFAKNALNFPKVRIKYLGVFDTVVSLLTVTPIIHFTAEELEKIDQITHICAVNETRDYFPLTSIQNKNGSKDLVNLENYYTAKVKEIFVPGAHADVGGGYTVGAEKVYLNQVRGSHDSLVKDLSVIRSTVKDNFSCANPQLIWFCLLDENVSFQPLNVGYNLVSERAKVSIEMCRAYFEVMASVSNTFCKTNIFEYKAAIGVSVLVKLRDDLIQYLNSNVPLKGACYGYRDFADYTHISANYGTVDKADTNATLNTFDPVLLLLEMQKIKEENPGSNLEMERENAIFETFDMGTSLVNIPSNGQWHRKVIYG